MRPLLAQVLHAVAHVVEKCAASGMNNKKDTIAWPICTFSWGSDAGTAGDLASRGRLCAGHVASCVAATKGCFNYGYSGDKGYAGL